jgi:phage tail P2-like protein
MGFGAAVIESGASVLEKVIADVEAEELLSIDAELIEANWDPYRVQTRNLPFLAFALGVQLWDDEWDEATKRSWLSIQWEFKSLRGTETALRIALGLWGYTLEQVLTPPQGFYASAEFTPEERNAWIQQMPQLRMKTQQDVGYGPVDEWFAGDSFLGEAFVGLDDGPILYGRRGFIRRNGVDTPLQSVILSKTVRNMVLQTAEQVYVPGVSTLGFFAGEDFVGDERFVGAAEQEAEIVTVNISQEAVSEEFTLGLSSVSPGLVPLNVTSQRISDVGDGGPFFYAGDFAGDGFAGDDPAADMLADVIYLLDPTVAVPMTDGISFAGVDRVGIEQNTAELSIDLHQKAGPFEWYAGETFVDEGCAVVEDSKPRENAFLAVLAAKALRDTVLVSFAPVRPLEFGDEINSTTEFGTWVTDLL